MNDDGKNPRPLVPYIPDGSQDAALIVAINEQYRLTQNAASMSGVVASPPVPLPPPVFAYDGSADAAMIAHWDAQRRQAALRAATSTGTGTPYLPEQDFPVLVSQAVITAYEKTTEGHLIRAVTFPLMAIIKRIMEDPSLMYGIDPRKWEQIVAGSYEASGLFDEVTLTPSSRDRGRDLIAVKKGFCSLRLIESVKRYTPGHVVTAEEVQALLGVLHGDHQASKGIVSTTWEFAPKIGENPDITQYIPHRLELVDGTALLERFKQYTDLR